MNQSDARHDQEDEPPVYMNNQEEGEEKIPTYMNGNEVEEEQPTYINNSPSRSGECLLVGH